MDRDVKKIWSGVLEAMRLAVSEATFKGYLKNTSLVEIREAGEKLVGEVGCSSGYIKTILEQKFAGQLVLELERITEKKCEVFFTINAQRSTLNAQDEKDLPLFEKRDTGEDVRRARLRPEFVFDNYAVSGSNQMAHAAALAVARKPGLAYNPLLIYGGVGVGKTHLMQAIGHSVIERGEGPVLFCTGEEFTNDLVDSIRNKSTDRVRTRYRKARVLMIDDVQFIAGKAAVQEEFFHTFNAIQREGGQIVMTSDRPPAEMAKMEERLRSRFGAGLIVDVGPADFELRAAILLIKAKQKQVDLPMDVAQAIASQIEGVRELEGVLARVMGEAELKNTPLTLEFVEGVLNLTQPANTGAKILTPNEVFNVVSEYYGGGVQALKGEKRTKTIAWPRQILMYILRNDLKLPFDEVGRLVGGRDHSTVMHADGKVREILKNDVVVHKEVTEIKKKLLILG
ncbi:MAG: chromosomal replication initiator protein DnaA [Patescibacteria group bacterium]